MTLSQFFEKVVEILHKEQSWLEEDGRIKWNGPFCLRVLEAFPLLWRCMCLWEIIWYSLKVKYWILWLIEQETKGDKWAGLQSIYLLLSQETSVYGIVYYS